MYQNSRLGEQMSSINHIVHCTNRLGTLSGLICSGIGGNPAEIQIPRHQPKASLANRLFKG